MTDKSHGEIITSKPQVIHLNVGGQRFTTYLSTLLKQKDSMLHTMFAGTLPVQPEPDGSYFIDRDGTHFRYILNYLRDGDSVQLPDFHSTRVHVVLTGARAEVPDAQMFSTYRELATEARFYGLFGLLSILKDPYVRCARVQCPHRGVPFRLSQFRTWCKDHGCFVRRHTVLGDGGTMEYDPTSQSVSIIGWHDTFIGPAPTAATATAASEYTTFDPSGIRPTTP